MDAGTRLKAAVPAAMIAAACVGAPMTESYAGPVLTAPVQNSHVVQAETPMHVLSRAMIGFGMQMPTAKWAQEFQDTRRRAETPAPSDAASRKVADICRTAKTASGVNRLLYVHRAWNRIPYARDEVAWHKKDYLAEPREFAARNCGDCDDYAFAKAWTLQKAGVPADRIFTVVFVEGKGLNTNRRYGSHAVCAVVDKDNKIYVLDNRHDGLRTMDQTLKTCGPPLAVCAMSGQTYVFFTNRLEVKMPPKEKKQAKSQLKQLQKQAAKPVAALSSDVPDFLAGAGAQIAQARLAEQGMRLSMGA